jgi:hypothetical protein
MCRTSGSAIILSTIKKLILSGIRTNRQLPSAIEHWRGLWKEQLIQTALSTPAQNEDII